MRFAIIEDKVVTNIIECDESFGLLQGWIPVGEIGVAISDIYEDGKFFVRTGIDDFGFVEPINIEFPAVLTIEERITKQETENLLLKQQLEATQAVVDQLLLGGI